jgi:hypothetical protein
MPFLYIIGITSIDKTYNIAFCLLPNKEESTYNFAIACFKALFNTVDCTLRIFITNYKVALKNYLYNYFLIVLQRACL